MKYEKEISIKTKISRNILSGFLGQIIIMVLGIVVPRLILVSYGSEVNGLLSSVTQIYAYFTLLEAGIGAATSQALYAPVGANNREEINSILSATRIYYSRAGAIYLILVLGMAIMYPAIVKNEIGYGVVFLIIIFQGMPGAINFLMQGKFKLLLGADGRTYIQTNVTTAVQVLSNLAKIILIQLGYGVLAVQFAFFILQLLQMVFYAVYQKKKYPWINYYSTPDFQAISQKNYAFVHQFSGLIFSNVDTLILTFFCGLKIVSVYSMYAMIMGLVGNILSTVSGGIYFYLGQIFHKDKNKYYVLHGIYETYYMGGVFALFTIAYILILPFLSIYTRGVNDIVYIDAKLPLLFVMVNMLSSGRGASLQVINFSQKFKETQHQSIIETMLNLLVSLVMVQMTGIYGVLLGTIIALLYRSNAIIIYANKKILNRSCWVTYRRWLANFGVFACIAAIAGKFTITVSSYLEFAMVAIPIGIAVLAIYMVVLSLLERSVFLDLLRILGLLKKKRGES